MTKRKKNIDIRKEEMLIDLELIIEFILELLTTGMYKELQSFVQTNNKGNKKYGQLPGYAKTTLYERVSRINLLDESDVAKSRARVSKFERQNNGLKAVILDFGIEVKDELSDNAISILTILNKNVALQKVIEVVRVFEVFFYYLEDRHDKINKGPAYGKSILELEGRLHEGSARLKITPDSIENGAVEVYTGDYKYEKEGKNIGQFGVTLFSERRSRSGYLKFYCLNLRSKKEILLGAYVITSRKKIVNGALVLKPAKKTFDESNSEIFANWKNKESFSNLEYSIRQYLSLKRYNYLRIKDGIDSIIKLEEFLDEQKFPNYKERFIDSGKPILYFAYPNTSINSDDFQKRTSLISKIAESFESEAGNVLQVEYRKGLAEYVPIDEVDQAPSSLAVLERTHLFVLYYNNTISGSFSLVQLGWVIAKSKRVLVFYKEGSLSENILRLKNYEVEFVPEIRNKRKIIRKIISVLSKDLKVYIGKHSGFDKLYNLK